MLASSINEPAAVPETEEERLAKVRRIVQKGQRRLSPDGHLIELPNTVQALLLKIFDKLQAGKAFSIVAEQKELTTQSAADLLAVSRPFLVTLLG
jgi:hypothetical protein